MNAGNRMVWSYDGHFYTLTRQCRDLERGGDRGPGPGRPPGDGERRRRAAVAARETFGRFGSIWIGFTDQAVEGTWVWADGDGRGLHQLGHGEPYNGRQITTTPTWSRGAVARRSQHLYTYRGIIELATADTDADGLPAGLDPYPADPLNAWDLREAGTDGLL